MGSNKQRKIDKEAAGRQKCYLHSLIMKHKQNPEVFLRETFTNNQI